MRSVASTLLAVPVALIALAGACGSAVEEPSIPSLQGRGHRSPFEGSAVSSLRGVVTFVTEEGGEHGFFLQDPRGDDDPATSDALVVAVGELPPPVSSGDLVAVSGSVEERSGSEGGLPVTTLVAKDLRILERGRSLPSPVALGPSGRVLPAVVNDDGASVFDPSSDALDLWESLEGMLVEVAEPVVVGPTTWWGGFAVVPEEGRGLSAPRTGAGGALFGGDEAVGEVVEVEVRPARRAPRVATGDRFVGSIVGVVDYAYEHYRVRPIGGLPEVEPRGPVEGRDEPRLQAGPERLTVSSSNVLNLSLVSSGDRFEALARFVVRDLGAPDVVALQEIQDDSGPEDDGTVSSAGTLGRLVRAVVAAGGPAYDPLWIDPLDGREGGEPGGNIRVAYLVDPGRVDVTLRGDPGPSEPARIEAGRLVPNPGRIEPDHRCFSARADGQGGVRRSLALEIGFRGQRLVLVNNHWSSKRGDDSLYGARQPPVRVTEERRTCQAEVVADFVTALRRAGGPAVVVLGDLNENLDRPPVNVLEGIGLENLVRRVPLADRYTYVYRGRSQLLDHLLVTPELTAGAEIRIVHGYADLPASRRASDHDALVASLVLTLHRESTAAAAMASSRLRDDPR